MCQPAHIIDFSRLNMSNHRHICPMHSIDLLLTTPVQCAGALTNELRSFL